MRAHWRAYSLALLEEACGKAGNAAEGLAVVSEPLTVVAKSGIRIYEPELDRLKGEFLLVVDPDSPAEAEVCFSVAREIARRDRAKSLELRATMSLARHWQRQARQKEASTALAEIFETFTEGITTPDLVDARMLLDSLA